MKSYVGAVTLALAELETGSKRLDDRDKTKTNYFVTEYHN